MVLPRLLNYMICIILSCLALVLKSGLCPLARQLCKSGCPVALRRELWCRALAVDPTLPQVKLMNTVGGGGGGGGGDGEERE